MSGSSFAGKLLVATPSLEDPNFHRTVVFLIAHQPDEGALGVVLNRPSELEIVQALPEWASLAAPPPHVFAGGPVTPEGAICLGQASTADGTVAVEGWEPVIDGVGVVDLNAGPEQFVALDGIRVFAGHSGWGAGQLEGELSMGGWFVLDHAAGDTVSDTPDELWRQVLERQPPKVAMFAKAPPHLSLN